MQSLSALSKEPIQEMAKALKKQQNTLSVALP